MIPTISTDAQKIIATAPPGFQDYALAQGGFGDQLTSGEAARLLSQFQSSGAYSGANVAAAVSGVTPTYNYADPYGARTAIEQRLGLTDAVTAEQAAQTGLLGFQDTTRKQINTLRDNRDLSSGLEAGFEAMRTREATQQEQVLTNELQLAMNKRLALEGKVGQEYEIYTGERASRQNILLQAIQAGAKNVNIGMSVEQLAGAYTSAAESKAKKERDDSYKSSLKAIALESGLKTSGSSKDLEKRIKKYNKSALDDAKQARDLQYESAKLSIAKQRQSLAEPQVTNVASLFGDSGSSGGSSATGSSGGGMSVDPSQSQYFNLFNSWGF